MLQTTTNINVDFYDKKYILINAKQLDRGIKTLNEGVDAEGKEYSRWMDNGSRFLSITCYNHGGPITFNSGEHAAYIRYKKADGHSVFNFCEIDRKGKIIIGLTEQMLAIEGICVADLVIVNKGKANVNFDTGEIININETAVLSTMPIHIDVTEVAVNNSDIESTYEFNLLNTKLGEYWADFEDVMKTSKSWAVGSTGIRDGENTDNSKYYANQSSQSANASNASAINAANSESNANEYMGNALTYSQNAQTYMDNANTYMVSANTSEANAKTSEENAKESETNAKNSETNAKTSETNALSYKEAVENINDSIVGSINTLASNGNIGSFIFMGIITFSELTSLSDDKKATGYVYCVTDDFTTDDNFVNGAGLSYTAGTNVYYTSDGYWNCLGGASSPTATVSEVKDYLGI